MEEGGVNELLRLLDLRREDGNSLISFFSFVSSLCIDCEKKDLVEPAKLGVAEDEYP